MHDMKETARRRGLQRGVKRGLASREPNAKDGRSHLLELTEAGRRMHGEIMPLALEMERRLFSNFTTEEIKAFRSLLLRIKEEVRDLHAEGIDSGIYNT